MIVFDRNMNGGDSRSLSQIILKIQGIKMSAHFPVLHFNKFFVNFDFTCFGAATINGFVYLTESWTDRNQYIDIYFVEKN